MSSDASDLTTQVPIDAEAGTAAEPVELADRVAAAVLAVPGVHDLHGGVLGEVATYLPGRRVNGVRLRDEETQIHLVLSWDAPVAITTAAVRDQVAGIVPGPVHVTVEDVARPSEPAPQAEIDPVTVPTPRS